MFRTFDHPILAFEPSERTKLLKLSIFRTFNLTVALCLSFCVVVLPFEKRLCRCWSSLKSHCTTYSTAYHPKMPLKIFQNVLFWSFTSFSINSLKKAKIGLSLRTEKGISVKTHHRGSSANSSSLAIKFNLRWRLETTTKWALFLLLWNSRNPRCCCYTHKKVKAAALSQDS